jgi:hypothetical protein
VVRLSVPAELAKAAAQRLPPGWTHTSDPAERAWRLTRAPGGGWVGARDDDTFAAGPDGARLLDVVIGDLELWVAEHAKGLIFVHAGAVVWQGRAIVIPGRSRAGKSTLVAELVRAGAGYLSDEYAVIDPSGLVLPYPRPLSLRARDGLTSARTPVQHLGGTVGAPARLGVVAHLQYDAARGWAPEPTTAAHLMLALLDNTVAARTRPVAAMDHLQAAIATAHGITGPRGDATDAAARVLLASQTSHPLLSAHE